jgi:ABC-type antimicrobial peptide transport system permease subunit
MSRTLAEVDASLPLFEVQTLDDRADQLLSASRFNTTVLALLGIIGLGLATVGVYGVMSHMVSLRTREIGMRIALGATRAEVIGLVLKRGLIVAAMGVAFGVGGALWIGNLMQSQLFQITSRDPVTLVFVTSILLGSATLACVVPATRAARLDPAACLREEQLS